MPRAARTKMKSFGSSMRVAHDSSDFYSRRMYASADRTEVNEIRENPVKGDAVDRIFCRSSERMVELPDDCVHLMVTSPPYNVGKDYDQDLSLVEYRRLLNEVFREVYRVLVVGGRACINIANLGRKPYIPLHSFVIEDILKLGFFMRGEIIWDKGSSAGTSMAWGSWLSAVNPTLRDTHEYILVFSKGNSGRLKAGDKRSTITKEEFMEFTKSVWRFPAEQARAVNHPAPFPVELPERLIKLYTFEGDVVLDPFMGSGTTAVAALTNNRHFIGYDTDEKYCRIAEKRIKEITGQGKLVPDA
ncbi:MAG: site-specific DNA-methyltransferase [Nitrososphaerota archaeon]|nr:site-specific DNA-methyltransferase [Nitrososphaerota archaeon]MDG7051924.1 site-specific DNA-methyltransferase [Nitrososphaerota archaeon]